MNKIKKIEWNDILYFWKNYLWKNRKTEIKSTNGLKFLEGYDKYIEQSIPTFFGAFINNKCIGVNSGHATSIIDYRSRGLYVLPEYRRNGIAQDLLSIVESQAKIEDKKIIWSIPRKSALQCYLKYGYRVASDWIEDLEFGLHCYVMKIIK